MQTGMENTDGDSDSDGERSNYSGSSSGSDDAEQSEKVLNTWFIQGGANLAIIIFNSQHGQEESH